jgi:hypothetical protein
MDLPAVSMAIAKGNGCLNLGRLSRIHPELFGASMRKIPFDFWVKRVFAAAFCAFQVFMRPIGPMARRVKGF